MIVAVGVALTALTAVASWSALRSHGRPFPGLFIDPHASFSAVWWPAWGAEMPPLRFPDRLIAIDGEPVPPPRDALRAAGAADRRAPGGAARARDTPRCASPSTTHDGPITIVRPLRPRGADEALFFFGLYALVGLFVLWSGLAVLVLARRRAGAVAYAAWSVGTFVFMVTFYDYHSAAWLAPLFSLSTVSCPGVRGLAGVLVPRAAPRRAARAARRPRSRSRSSAAVAARSCSRSGRTSRLDLRALRARRQRRSRSRACWC